LIFHLIFYHPPVPSFDLAVFRPSPVSPPSFELLPDWPRDNIPPPVKSPLRPVKAHAHAVSSSRRLSSSPFVSAKRAIESIDLNRDDPFGDSSPLQPLKRRLARVKFPQTPWDIGLCKTAHDPFAALEFYNWVVDERPLDLSCWVRHNVPSCLSATGDGLRTQFSPYGELSSSICDLLLRAFGFMDLKLYGKKADSVWRHFLASSFAVRILSRKTYRKSTFPYSGC
jgi:hypothetical protein